MIGMLFWWPRSHQAPKQCCLFGQARQKARRELQDTGLLGYVRGGLFSVWSKKLFGPGECSKFYSAKSFIAQCVALAFLFECLLQTPLMSFEKAGPRFCERCLCLWALSAVPRTAWTYSFSISSRLNKGSADFSYCWLRLRARCENRSSRLKKTFS